MNPNFLKGDGANPYNPGSKDYYKYQDWLRKQEKVGCPEEIEEHLEKLIASLESVALKQEFKNDNEQIKLLAGETIKAKKLLLQIIDNVGHYMAAREKLRLVETDKDKIDRKDYQSIYSEADRGRNLAHNTLIDSINIARRFISSRFGDMGEDAIDEWEYKEEAAGRKVVYAERTNFGNNIVCPENIDLNNRDRIADWAEQVFACRTKLKNRLSNND